MIMFRVHKLAAVAVAAMLSACAPIEAVNLLASGEGYERTEGIAYGPEDRQRLDLYRPKEPGPSGTVVVFLYGGAWKRGAREDYGFAAAAFAARGYVTIVPDYRLYPEVRFPAFVEDAALAVGWVRQNITAHGGNPDRIVLAGHSAGAHSAALLALDRCYLARNRVPDSAILGVVGLAGPYSFDPTTFRTTKEVFATAARADNTRPVAFARAGAPPMLLIHGLDDSTVLPRNSEDLAKALQAEGAEARYLPFERLGHPGVLLALVPLFEGLAPVVSESLGFIEGLGPRVTAEVTTPQSQRCRRVS